MSESEARAELEARKLRTFNEIFVAGVTRFQMQITGPGSFRFPVCVEETLDGAQRAAAIAMSAPENFS